MTRAKHWTVDILINEDEGERRTHAEARLQADDTPDLRGHGTARRNPDDPEVPAIGDELAVARALADLAHRLVDAAASDIEASAEQQVRLRG